MYTKIVLSCVLIACFSSFAKCDKAVIEDCGSVSGSIVKVDMLGCDGHDRCPLKKGANATLTALFKSNVASNTLKAVVYGTVGPFKTKFILPNPDACQSGVACPLVPGQTYNYTVSIYVKASYPRVHVDIEFHLIDDQAKDVVCAEIPAQIVTKSYLN